MWKFVICLFFLFATASAFRSASKLKYVHVDNDDSTSRTAEELRAFARSLSIEIERWAGGNPRAYSATHKFFFDLAEDAIRQGAHHRLHGNSKFRYSGDMSQCSRAFLRLARMWHNKSLKGQWTRMMIWQALENRLLGGIHTLIVHTLLQQADKNWLHSHPFWYSVVHLFDENNNHENRFRGHITNLDAPMVENEHKIEDLIRTWCLTHNSDFRVLCAYMIPTVRRAMYAVADNEMATMHIHKQGSDGWNDCLFGPEHYGFNWISSLIKHDIIRLHPFFEQFVEHKIPMQMEEQIQKIFDLPPGYDVSNESNMFALAFNDKFKMPGGLLKDRVKGDDTDDRIDREDESQLRLRILMSGDRNNFLTEQKD